MEISIIVKCLNIKLAQKYYVDSLQLFDIDYQEEEDEVGLTYIHDKTIKFVLQKETDKKTCDTTEIMMQVPNAESVFYRLKDKKLEGYGIIWGAYKFKEQSITFLTAPPGNYFQTNDSEGNKIIFFDKYDERIEV